MTTMEAGALVPFGTFETVQTALGFADTLVEQAVRVRIEPADGGWLVLVEKAPEATPETPAEDEAKALANRVTLLETASEKHDEALARVVALTERAVSDVDDHAEQLTAVDHRLDSLTEQIEEVAEDARRGVDEQQLEQAVSEVDTKIDDLADDLKGTDRELERVEELLEKKAEALEAQAVAGAAATTQVAAALAAFQSLPFGARLRWLVTGRL